VSEMRFGPEPTDDRTVPRSLEELTVAFAQAVSERSREPGGRVDRGLPEARAFGTLISDLRARQGLDCLELAQRARLDPVWLMMLEKGLLAPEEIPAMVVARLAVALGRELSELPLTPYVVDAEPGDEVESAEGETRLRLGLSTLTPWVSALLGTAPPAVPSVVWLPDFDLRAGGRRWHARRVHLTDLPMPIPASDEYSWQLLRGRRGAGQEGWSLFASIIESQAERPGEVEVELTMGTQRRIAADPHGHLRFERLDPTDLEPLRFALLRAPGRR